MQNTIKAQQRSTVEEPPDSSGKPGEKMCVGAVPFPIAIGMERIAGTMAESGSSVDGHQSLVCFPAWGFTVQHIHLWR